MAFLYIINYSSNSDDMNAVFSYPTLYEKCLLSSRTGLAGIILYACPEHMVTNGVYITLPVSTYSCTLSMEKEIKED